MTCLQEPPEMSEAPKRHSDSGDKFQQNVLHRLQKFNQFTQNQLLQDICKYQGVSLLAPSLLVKL